MPIPSHAKPSTDLSYDHIRDPLEYWYCPTWLLDYASLNCSLGLPFRIVVFVKGANDTTYLSAAADLARYDDPCLKIGNFDLLRKARTFLGH